MKKENKDWLISLERERHDMSYLLPPKEIGPTEYTKVVYRDKVVDHRFRDNIMYHFGRYSEGAVDDQAKNAAKIAKKLIAKEGK